MGKAKRQAARRARERQAQRAASRRSISARTNRTWWQTPTALGSGALAIVVIVVVVVVVIGQTSSTTGPTTSDRTPVSTSVLSALTQPSDATLAAVAGGGQPGNLAKLPNSTPTSDSSGKPLVIYVGAEYCPYCAAERWSLIAALSRFGTLTGLQETMSGASPEPAPNTSTFTFLSATYSSSWIGFQSAELQDRNKQPLQTPSAQVLAAFQQYDKPPYTAQAEQYPFLDIADEYVLMNTSYNPVILQGLSWDQIASQLGDPKNPIALAILGNANIITAAICHATNNQPQSVCAAPYLQSVAASLPS
ncbi:MAG: DUF929 family protein [Candidatus Dormibacteraeota bacterium]|nr:DUF929 family protein [Candidatus Dormibacteraeota bacterium]